jgi:hypothetical protein
MTPWATPQQAHKNHHRTPAQGAEVKPPEGATNLGRRAIPATTMQCQCTSETDIDTFNLTF